VRLEVSLEDEPFVGAVHSFARDPQTFYERIKPLFEKMIKSEPNLAHDALADRRNWVSSRRSLLKTRTCSTSERGRNA
jgi:hypothetical protein